MGYAENEMAELHGMTRAEWKGDQSTVGKLGAAIKDAEDARLLLRMRVFAEPPVATVTSRDIAWQEYRAFVDHHARREDYGPPTGVSREQMFNWSLVALGLAGEAGEVADHIKKWLYHGAPMDWDKFDIEMGDLFWYWTRALSLRGRTPSDIMKGNVAKLEKRYASGAFSTAESVARADET